MPIVHGIRERFGELSGTLLLPVFFAYSGLRTDLTPLGSDPELWLWAGLVLAVAVIGKLVGSALAARMAGTGWMKSWQIGILMNCRGLTELVVLNIGLDLKIVSSAMFTILVLMAFASTAMTAPLFKAISPRRPNLRAASETLFSDSQLSRR
jgi:Kef-type K+ transport system membrane component KefB